VFWQAEATISMAGGPVCHGAKSPSSHPRDLDVAHQVQRTLRERQRDATAAGGSVKPSKEGKEAMAVTAFEGLPLADRSHQ
jgi:hypothetical protein